MEDLLNPEEKIFCPYDNAHVIMRNRMSRHLIKCKKNFPNQKMVRCDYNAAHLIPEPELAYHHQVCSHRKVVEPQLVGQISAQDKFPIQRPDMLSGEENWDDFDCPTYNPQAYTEKAEVLRQLDNESKSKRKNFHVAERQRINQITSVERPPVAPIEKSTVLPNLPKKLEVLEEKTNIRDIIRDKIRAGAHNP